MARTPSISPDKYEAFMEHQKTMSYKKLGEKYGVSASTAYYLHQKIAIAIAKAQAEAQAE